MEEELPPVLVSMDVHCRRCSLSICRSIRPIYGVYDVIAHVATGTVVVRGSDHLDPAMIKRYLELFTEERCYRRRHHGGRSRVKVLADGGRPKPHVAHIDYDYAPMAHYPYYPPPYHQQHYPYYPPPYHQPPPPQQPYYRRPGPGWF